MNTEQSVWVVNREYPNGYTVGPHTHSQGQLTYAIAGVMALSVGEHMCLIPPARGLWIPSEMEHRMRARRRLAAFGVHGRPRRPADHPRPAPGAMSRNTALVAGKVEPKSKVDARMA
jgi:hypothetical protein